MLNCSHILVLFGSLLFLAETRVDTTGVVFQQILMAALFDQNAILHDDDVIGVANSAESVSNDDNGDALDFLAIVVDGSLHLLLFDGVEC